MDKNHTQRAMAAFGHTESEAQTAVIAGGGNIGMLLARKMTAGKSSAAATIIEIDKQQARTIAERLTNITVVNGDALDGDILEEAGVGSQPLPSLLFRMMMK